MLQVKVDDQSVQHAVKEVAVEYLQPYKRELMSVSIKQLSEMTSLTPSFLRDHIVHEKEMKRITRKIGARTIYLYPKVVEAFNKVVDRKNLLEVPPE